MVDGLGWLPTADLSQRGSTLHHLRGIQGKGGRTPRTEDNKLQKEKRNFRSLRNLKHRKNCKCCPVSLLNVRSQRLPWIRFFIVKIVISVSSVASLHDCLCNCQNGISKHLKGHSVPHVSYSFNRKGFCCFLFLDTFHFQWPKMWKFSKVIKIVKMLVM